MSRGDHCPPLHECAGLADESPVAELSQTAELAIERSAAER